MRSGYLLIALALKSSKSGSHQQRLWGKPLSRCNQDCQNTPGHFDELRRVASVSQFSLHNPSSGGDPTGGLHGNAVGIALAHVGGTESEPRLAAWPMANTASANGAGTDYLGARRTRAGGLPHRSGPGRGSGRIRGRRCAPNGVTVAVKAELAV